MKGGWYNMLGDMIKSFGAFKKSIKPEKKEEVKTYRVGDLIETLDNPQASKEDKQKAIRLLHKVAKGN